MRYLVAACLLVVNAVIGAALGFGLGAAILRIYENHAQDMSHKTGDTIIGVTTVVVCIVVVFVLALVEWRFYKKNYKECVQCASLIRARATKCPRCGSEQTTASAQS
ncbi:MAG: hypothetical protein JW797_14695 [Bradymonadales bacterium]|nr:hypothetical protein [Bradymonadales bacterium]